VGAPVGEIYGAVSNKPSEPDETRTGARHAVALKCANREPQEVRGLALIEKLLHKSSRWLQVFHCDLS
jgi:hypothetical protein